MADVIALSSSIIQLLTAVKDFIGYVAIVKRSYEERSQLFLEVQNLAPLLESLRDSVQVAQPDSNWIKNVKLLDRPGGPIVRFRSTLGRFQKRLVNETATTISLKQRLIWPFEKRQMRDWLDETERFKTYLILALQNDQMWLISKAIKSDTSKIDTNMNVVIQDPAGLSISLDGQVSASRLRQALEWLSSLEPQDKQNMLVQAHLEGSNQWFFNSEIYQSWCSGSQKILCCDGEAGAGKTILVSQIIKHLKTTYPDYPVLYAYCEYGESLLKSPSDCIATFLKQLIQFNGRLPEDIQNLKLRFEKQGLRPTTAEMQSILKTMLESYPTAFIIIDALDEYKAVQEDLLQKIASIQGNSRMLFTIRATYLEAWLSNVQRLGFHSPVGVHFHAASQDIELYIYSQLPTMPRYVISDPEMVQLITDQVVKSASGRFLIAVLCANILRDCTTKKEARIALQRLENQENLEALEQLYEQILERIQTQDPGYRRLAERTLGWLAWNLGNLENIAEFQHALAVEPETSDLDIDNNPEIETIVSTCLGMVVFDNVSQVIRFVHYSAATCIRRFYFTQNISTHCDILEACLTYLSFDAFRVGPCSNDEEMESRIRKYPFLLYASANWGDHARECINATALVDERCMKLRSTVTDYLHQTENRNAAAQIEYGREYGYIDITSYPKNMSALHVAASSGLYSTVNTLLTDGADIDAQDSYGCTPLNRAARRGQQFVTSLLLEKGANLHTPDNYGQSALHMAAWNGHIHTVEILTENGAILDAGDHEGQTALHKAAIQGNQQIIVTLAKNGAEFHLRDNLQRSPLDLALAGGHDPLKWPMMQNWIRDLALEDYQMPPLHQAIRYGTTAQVEQILDAGHSIDEADSWDRTALLEAARCGLKSTTQLLIDRGADITVEGQPYASGESRENVVLLAADSCYVNYYGDKGKQIKEEERRENAMATLSVLLTRLIAIYGSVDGLTKYLENEENKEKVHLAAQEVYDVSRLLEITIKLVLQEAAGRDSKRPRRGGCRFE